MTTVRIYPDTKEVTLRRSAPPSTPTQPPGPTDVRTIPKGRDLTVEVDWLAGQRFHYWLPEQVAGVGLREGHVISGEDPQHVSSHPHLGEASLGVGPMAPGGDSQ